MPKVFDRAEIRPQRFGTDDKPGLGQFKYISKGNARILPWEKPHKTAGWTIP